jgi:hypothetical protein
VPGRTRPFTKAQYLLDIKRKSGVAKYRSYYESVNGHNAAAQSRKSVGGRFIGSLADVGLNSDSQSSPELPKEDNSAAGNAEGKFKCPEGARAAPNSPDP